MHKFRRDWGPFLKFMGSLFVAGFALALFWDFRDYGIENSRFLAIVRRFWNFALSFSAADRISVLALVAAIFSAWAARSSAKSARQSFELTRPWLFLSDARICVGPGREKSDLNGPGFSITVRNLGKTPAIDIVIDGTYEPNIRGIISKRTEFKRRFAMIMDGKEEAVFEVIVPFHTVGNDRAFARGDQIWIDIVYTDPTKNVTGRVAEIYYVWLAEDGTPTLRTEANSDF